MTAVAPVLFHAFPENAPHDQEEPSLECFNAGASADGVEALRAPFKMSRAIWGAGALIIAGVATSAAALFILVFLVLTHDADPFGAVTEMMEPFGVPSAVLLFTGIAWALALSTSLNPKTKAWRRALGDAWLTHGGQIIALKDVPFAIRSQVADDLTILEAHRNGLNRLDPEGDELDGARYALQRFIEVSDIPLLGKRAALATHIKDPAVRQAAKEYAQAVKQQDLARHALDTEIESVKDLHARRRQARTDAEIIRLVHER
jgi:hypothetical protein